MKFTNEIHAISDIVKRLEISCESELKPVKESVQRHLRDFKDGSLNGTDLQKNLKITLASFPKWIGVLNNSKIVDLFNAFSEVYQQDIQAVDFNKIVAAQRIRSGYMYEKNTLNIEQLSKSKLKNLRSLRNSCYGYFDCIFQIIDVVVSAKHRVIVKVWDGLQHHSLDKLFYLPQQDYLEKVCPASIYSLVSKDYNVEILTYGSFARQAKLLKPGDIVMFVNIHLAVTDVSTWNLTMHEGGASFNRGIYHVNPASDEYKEVESRCMRTMEELINVEDSFNIECLVSDLSGQNEVHSNAIREHTKNTNSNLEDTLNPFASVISDALDKSPAISPNGPVPFNRRESLNNLSHTANNRKRSFEPSGGPAPDKGTTISMDNNQQASSAVQPRKSPVVPLRTSSIQGSSSTKSSAPSNIVTKKVQIAHTTHTACTINPPKVKEVSSNDNPVTASKTQNVAGTQDFTYWPERSNHSKPKAPRHRSTPKAKTNGLANLSDPGFEEKIVNAIFSRPNWLNDTTLPEEIRRKLSPIKKVTSEELSAPQVSKETVHAEIIEVESSSDDEIVIIMPPKPNLSMRSLRARRIK
ncbi:unnamed protein product [Auanema sp. JU1783]|nr:unnamed protein product [Auanema sp. JU1783]